MLPDKPSLVAPILEICVSWKFNEAAFSELSLSQWSALFYDRTKKIDGNRMKIQRQSIKTSSQILNFSGAPYGNFIK